MSHATEPRAVFDTNTLVSALLFRASTPRLALDYAFDHGKVLISLPLVRELYRVLHYPRLERYITPDERAQFLGQLTREGILTTITVQLQVVRDPDDNFVLDLAVSGGANVIISGDSDLLTLGRYDSIPIRTPAQYLQDPGQP
jgi:putative PIN family toxin of toxin-antitoxin system